MDIKIIDNNYLQEYDELVDNSMEGTIFHKSWWLNIFKEYYGKSYEIKLYGAFKNNVLIGAIPIPLFHKYGTNFIYPPKLTPYLGPFFLANKEEKTCTKISREKEINDKFTNALKEYGHCLYYPFSHNNLDLQPFKWDNFGIGVHYTYLLKLHNLNKVLDDMDKKRRNDITKRAKQKYTIKNGGIEDNIELINQTMRRQGQPLIDKRILLAIFKECKKHNNCEIFTMYDETDTPSSSLLLVWDTKRSYYLGSGIRGNSRGDLSLLLLEAIRYTKEKLNLSEFDFEGSDVKSIEFFFRGFGGQLSPLFFIYENSMSQAMLMRTYQFVKNYIRIV